MQLWQFCPSTWLTQRQFGQTSPNRLAEKPDILLLNDLCIDASLRTFFCKGRMQFWQTCQKFCTRNQIISKIWIISQNMLFLEAFCWTRYLQLWQVFPYTWTHRMQFRQASLKAFAKKSKVFIYKTCPAAVVSLKTIFW